MRRTISTILALALIGAAATQASARGTGATAGGGSNIGGGTVGRTGAHMPSGTIGGSSSGTGPGYAGTGSGKVAHAPVPLKRMTLGLGCFQRRYNQLRAAGQDDGLAAAGAALICG
jgi:hypothetical protein